MLECLRIEELIHCQAFDGEYKFVWSELFAYKCKYDHLAACVCFDPDWHSRVLFRSIQSAAAVAHQIQTIRHFRTPYTTSIHAQFMHSDAFIPSEPGAVFDAVATVILTAFCDNYRSNAYLSGLSCQFLSKHHMLFELLAKCSIKLPQLHHSRSSRAHILLANVCAALSKHQSKSVASDSECPATDQTRSALCRFA